MKFEAKHKTTEKIARFEYSSLSQAQYHNPYFINWKEIPDYICLNCGSEMELDDLGDDDCKKTCYCCTKCMNMERRY